MNLLTGIHWDKEHNTRLNLSFLRVNFVGVTSSEVFERAAASPTGFPPRKFVLDQNPKTVDWVLGMREFCNGESSDAQDLG